MRAALYARFSTDHQTPRSIVDQLVECRRLAERLGASVVGEFSDAAISGAATANRPGFNDLMEAVRRGEIDVIVAEELSRLTRDGGHAWDFYNDVTWRGVEIHTVAEGRVDEMTIGFKGTMNALERKATGARVRRGLKGVVREGRLPGALVYGYRIKVQHDANGERIKGLREIEPEQAEVVRRIFAEFIGGSSGHAIARRLNEDGIPGPSGQHWRANSIVGVPSRGSGTLRCALYVGEIVWGQRVYGKDRQTGRMRSKPGDPENLTRQAVPELAIIAPEVFQAAQARLQGLGEAVARSANPSAANAPKRLLSGLVICGVCKNRMVTTGTRHGYRCKVRIDLGAMGCANDRGPPADVLEQEVLARLQTDLLHPEVIETAVREYRALAASRAKGRANRKANAEREIGEVRRRISRLLDQMEDGLGTSAAVRERLTELERRQGDLQTVLAEEDSKAEVVALHPQTAARYRALVTSLQAKLANGVHTMDTPGRDAARVALRQVVKAVHIHPEPQRGKYRIELDADLINLLGLGKAQGQRKARSL